MPVTFLLLQTVNAALAAASLWTRFRDPTLWHHQAAVLSTFAGSFLASLTVILLSLSMVFSWQVRWRSTVLNLLLALGFVALQGWMLFLVGRDLGLFRILKSKLG